MCVEMDPDHRHKGPRFPWRAERNAEYFSWRLRAQTRVALVTSRIRGGRRPFASTTVVSQDPVASTEYKRGTDTRPGNSGEERHVF